ncbi:MAG: 16S rRNA (guanine(966)-N(2))-methyltransferase RsmD [Flavobacteriales bacterium]|nr:16S rRNA (guanine(966)-N(2))-methyltransferase RsmD [Flavobacteriales bacterium]
MRIISGFLKGRKIEPPKDFTARPTTDFAREGLFNMLFNRKEIQGARVLDLFAGSGTVSFEFVSRGAAEVVAVDKDLKSVNFIRKKSEELNVPQLKPLRADAVQYISRAGLAFDIIFCDPPFDRENIAEIADAVFKGNILKKDGLFILEHEDIHSFEEHKYFLEDRKYGRVKFTFFAWPEE